MILTLVLWRIEQEDHKVEATLGYVMKLYLIKNQTK